MFGYRVPAPDEAMLISGARFGQKRAPFRVVTGHGAFVMPIFQKARYLTLAMQEAEVAEQCVTKQGITLLVRAVVEFKVGNDPESIIKAGQRFLSGQRSLSDQQQMSLLTRRIFAGHLRPIIGSMTVEEIVTERQKLANEVFDGSKPEMAGLGLSACSLQIHSLESTDEMGSRYIAAMAARSRAANLAQADQAQQDSERPP
jgi:flotillin